MLKLKKGPIGRKGKDGTVIGTDRNGKVKKIYLPERIY